MSKIHATSRIRRIKLEDLIPRRRRLHKMPKRSKQALTEIIKTLGAYPAVIVRPHPRLTGKYEIVDGHNRLEVLSEMGESAAKCEVWQLGDEQAAILSLSLNGLRSRPDVHSRAKVLETLGRSLGKERLGEMLALTPAAMRQQLTPLKPPKPAKEQPGGKWDLHPTVFHLSTTQQRCLNRALGRRKTAAGRADALMAAIGVSTKGDK